MKVKWSSSEWSTRTEFLFYEEPGYPGYAGLNDHAVVTKIEKGEAQMQVVPQGERIPGPTLILADYEASEFLQSFLDEAWDKGFRPTKEKQTREQVEREIDRLENHLEDMRSLVFGLPAEEEREPKIINERKR